MKNFILFVLAMFFSLSIKAQDNICESSYAPFKEGMKLEYTNFDHKHRAGGRQEQSISNIEAIDGGFLATIDLTVFTKYDKEDYSGSFAVECQNGEIKMDLSGMISPSIMESLQIYDSEIMAEKVEIPSNLKVGDELPNGLMEITMNTGLINNIKSSVHLKNRKVEAFEKVTTPAGTFDCVKISQETVMESTMMNKSSNSTTWYAKGIGTVKTENYYSSGKLQNSMELTKIEK